MRLTVLALLVAVLLPWNVLAVECESNDDCPEGTECVAVPCACACPAPAEGEEAEECVCDDCPTTGECISTDDWDDDGYGEWYSNLCETDADCPMEFTCQEVELPCAVPDCACVCPACDPDDPACDPNAECECDCPEPQPCPEETTKACVFSPTDCSADADCSEGFECVEIEECSGGGSAGCACAGCACPDCEGEDCPPCDCPTDPEPCECDEVPEEEVTCNVVASICAPKQIECEDDAGCPEGWECLEGGGDAPTCACTQCVCEPCPEGETCEPCECPEDPEPCDCGGEEFVAESYCIPGGWGEAGFVGGAAESTGTDEDGEEAPTMMDAATEQQAKNAEANAEPEDGTPKGEEETAAAGTEDKSEGGSCSAAGGPNGMLSLLLAGLALSLLALRRRTTVN